MGQGKGFFQSGTILASLGTLFAGLDLLHSVAVEAAPLLPPQATAAVVTLGSILAIIRRVVAKEPIVKVL